MTIRWTKDKKVERYPDHAEPPSWGELAAALDECVAALRSMTRPYLDESIETSAYQIMLIRDAVLEKLGVEP